MGMVLDGRYRVERLLGEGGMGAVYEGRHVLVGKKVAIKMLHAEYASNEEILRRFYREAQSAAAVPRFIDEVYNAKRMHSSLGYWAPEEYEQLWKTGELAKLGIDPSFKLKGKPSN